MSSAVQHPHPATGLADAQKWHAVEGVLKGYDQLLNLVLDETVEYARGTLLIAAGQTLSCISPHWHVHNHTCLL